MPKKPSRRDRGAAAVEFALVLPFLLTIVFGVIEFGWAYGQLLDVRHGAREGARLIAVNDLPVGLTADDLTAQEQSNYIVEQICDRMDLSIEASVSLGLATAGEASAGQVATIVVSSDLDTITGWFDPVIGNKNLASRLELRIEQEATWAEVSNLPCETTSYP